MHSISFFTAYLSFWNAVQFDSIEAFVGLQDQVLLVVQGYRLCRCLSVAKNESLLLYCDGHFVVLHRHIAMQFFDPY
jgi:hypothetical protein